MTDDPAVRAAQKMKRHRHLRYESCESEVLPIIREAIAEATTKLRAAARQVCDECSDDLPPSLGAIAQLEAALDRFEAREAPQAGASPNPGTSDSP